MKDLNFCSRNGQIGKKKFLGEGHWTIDTIYKNPYTVHSCWGSLASCTHLINFRWDAFIDVPSIAEIDNGDRISVVLKPGPLPPPPQVNKGAIPIVLPLLALIRQNLT